MKSIEKKSLNSAAEETRSLPKGKLELVTIFQSTLHKPK
jgi:hypothetical protein